MTGPIQRSKELPDTGTDCLWKSLTQWYPSEGEDFWGSLTGPPLALLLKEAGYSIHQQVEILQFHHHWVVPTLGSAPDSNSVFKWQTILNPNGFPLEYAWNWNTSTGKPQIRTSWEPIGSEAGTDLDPLNQSLYGEYLDRLAKVAPNTDLSWSSSLLSSLFSPDKDAYTKSGALDKPSTSLVAGMEFTHLGAFRSKGYFVSRLPGQKLPLPLSHWSKALRALNPNLNNKMAVLEEFLTTSSEGKELRPYMAAVDHHAGPSGSRLKWYMKTASTSFRSVREIMTLGGRISDIDRELDSLYDLIKRLGLLSADHPEENETVLPTSENMNFLGIPRTAHYFYYFDIAAYAELPIIKIYIPLQNYRKNDLDIARTIVGWMEVQGRGSYGENYLRVLQGLADGKLDECWGYHTFFSFAVKANGKVDVTSYLAPSLSLGVCGSGL
ncbi:dimethylallyl tryptophan synthase GliD1 [Penicillium angulare]|uniref:dimethylallyl tryptophan synthase GliD1 n=1 Tax=Penicillium angulare TaxID=116970 RepID=UPI00254143F5|nr:dimethylallyl tryptophan synthase GliD1 [Penicillium angulare]KAJ5286795.1 dimethylallyl tryptophan synthase GliD1 [Penicillium angulare]